MCTFLFWMEHCGIWDRCKNISKLMIVMMMIIMVILYSGICEMCLLAGYTCCVRFAVWYHLYHVEWINIPIRSHGPYQSPYQWMVLMSMICQTAYQTRPHGGSHLMFLNKFDTWISIFPVGFRRWWTLDQQRFGELRLIGFVCSNTRGANYQIVWQQSWYMRLVT